MVKWEYCEVCNNQGHVTIAYLTEEGDGWDSHKVAERRVKNMAKVLARLGREGWEVIAIHPWMMGGAFTTTEVISVALLKRPLSATQ